MKGETGSVREQWSSRSGFLLATLGCAVGLGNIWRFAYVAGENGGAAFLVIYAACVVLVGLPAMLAEFVLGARSRSDVVAAFASVRGRRSWRWAGTLALFAAFLILSYYAVVAGWAYKYLYDYAAGSVAGLSEDTIGGRFDAFLAHPFEPVVWQALFLASTAVLVAAGVQRGIELASRLLMPLLAALVLVLAGYALSLPAAAKGLAFLFAPDWSALSRPQLYLDAIGQTFFSLGVGAGVLVTYASYSPGGQRLSNAALAIAIGDTLFAIVAGIAIFPAVFAFGLDPAQGPALAFVTLPKLFAVMPGGGWFALAFFFLLSAAALTSAVSVLEVPVAWLMRRGLSRRDATLWTSTAAFAAGLPSALGGSLLAGLRPFGRDVLGTVDHFAADVLLPAAAIAVLLYVGYALPRNEVRAASGLSRNLATAWLVSVRYAAPAALAAMLVWSLAA